MTWRFTILQYSPYIETAIDEPPGWDTIIKTIQRDPDTHGIVFNFSESNLLFIEAAYWIIKAEYLLNRVDGDIGMRIEWLCDECDGYQQLYEGKLDFERYQEVCGDDCSISIGLQASETEVLIKNRMETSVDLTSNIAYDGVTTLTDYPGLNKEIIIPGKAILIQSKAINEAIVVSGNLVTSSEWHQNTSGGATGEMRAQLLPAFTKVILSDILDTSFYSTIDIVNGGFNNRPDGIFPVIDFKPISGLNCLSSDAVLNYRYKGVINSVGGPPVATFKIFHFNAGGDLANPVDFTELVSTSLGASGTPFDISGTLTVTLNIGDQIFCYIFLHTFSVNSYSSYIVSEDPECLFDVSLKSLCDSSPAKTYLIHEAGSRIVESITNNTYRFKSEYYGRIDSQPYSFTDDGCGSLRTLTNGLQLRRAVLQDQSAPKVFLSLKDFYESLNAIDCVGMGIERNDVRVEPIEYFYSEEIIFVADGINEITTTIRNDRNYNQFNFGYDKFETETTNGLDAIHTKREYRLAIKNSSNKLEKISKIIADGYAIEVTRRKFGLSEDWRMDQNIFILCLQRIAGVLTVEQNNITSPENLFDPPTVINYAISPIRNAMRWFKWIVQGLRDYANSKILFSSGEGNYVAKGKLNTGCIEEGVAIAENETLQLSKFADPATAAPFTIPEKDVFKFPMGLNEFVFVAGKKYGKIQYRRLPSDDWKYGWIDSLKFDPNAGEADFSLITRKN